MAIQIAVVPEVADADAAVGEVKSGKTFYSVAPPKKTGMMPTKAIVAGSDLYEAGYHAGNGGGLDAIDPDLAPANIKEGVAIFGKLGTFVPTLATTDLGPIQYHHGGKVTCNVTVMRTAVIPADATWVFAYHSLGYMIGKHTLRIKYKGVLKAEVTNVTQGALKGISWDGDADGGGDLVWEVHCQENGWADPHTGGFYIKLS